MKKLRSLLLLVLCLALISLALYGIKSLCFLFVKRTLFADSMASMVSMLLATVALLIAARLRHIPLSTFPARFGPVYITVTAAAAVLLLTTPSAYTGAEGALLLLYSSVVTPVFEELVFRGYVWNRLSALFGNGIVTYALSVLLFGLWHLGYVDTVIFRAGGNILNIMLWKVITGAAYGVVLGFARLKCRNSYICMLLHGVMNLFGR